MISGCPCKSGKSYEECCKPFHQGKLPETALKLMRSRYAAYALCMPDYIIHTTHPESPEFRSDRVQWSKTISAFCANTEFKDLKILHSEDGESFATVTFYAHLIQNHKDASFTEKSYFEKVKGRWLYRRGRIARSCPFD